MTPDRTDKLVMWGGLAVGVGALIVAILNLMNGPSVASTPQGMTLNIPGGGSGPGNYQPATFNIPGLHTTGSTTKTNPGTTSLVFSFPVTNTTNNAGNGKDCCAGCGSSTGVDGCSSPGATTAAFGDPATAAASIWANMGPAMLAAFNIGQQIRQEQNWNLLSATGDAGGNALYTSPLPGPSVGGLFGGL